LVAAGHRCQVCDADMHLDVHHRTYDRFGHEDPGDLTVLCRDCHRLYHERKKAAEPKKKRKKAKARRAESKKGRAELRALEAENDRLHAVQAQNKKKKRLVREGQVSPLLRGDLVDRHRS
jgi:hypothetical protein